MSKIAVFANTLVACAAFASCGQAQAIVGGAGADHSPATPATSARQRAAAGPEEVVVTARRVKERVQDVPVAVTALSGRTLAQRHVTQLAQLSNVAPGLTITPANSPTTLVLTVRGLGNSNPNTGSDAAVGLYLNDVPINLQNGTNLGLFDLQDVEVLKGPQGTLFGRNTTGGAILINSARPNFNGVSGYAQAGGTFFQINDGAQGEAVLNLPINDVLAVRAGIDVVNRGGFVRNVIDRDLPSKLYTGLPAPSGTTNFKPLEGQESEAARVSVLYKPNEWLENLTVYDDGYDTTTSLATNTNALNPNGAIAQFGPLLGYPDPIVSFAQLQQAQRKYYWSTVSVANTPLKLETHNLSNTTTYFINSYLTLKNVFGYRHVQEEYTQDIVSLPGYYFIYSQANGGYDLSDELQLSGHNDHGLKWVGGLFFFDESRYSNTNSIVQFGGPGNTVLFHLQSKSYSAYGQATQSIPYIPGLSATVGLRYTVDQRAATDSRYTGSVFNPLACSYPGVSIADCQVSGSRTFSSPTYTVSLDYKLDPKTLLYFATRRGYRSGGFSATAASATDFKPFQPETLTDYEIGVKRDWALPADIRFRSNIALYHDDFSNIQRQIVDATDPTIQTITNIPTATVNGAEFELFLTPVSGLNIGYSYAVVFPKYGNYVLNGQDFSGRTFADAPQHIHVGSVSYETELGDSLGLLRLGANYHYQTSQFYDDRQQTTAGGIPQGVIKQPGYGLLDLSASLNNIRGSHVDAEVFATNLTDTHASPAGVPLYNSLGVGFTEFSVLPRMVGFNLRYRFGS